MRAAINPTRLRFATLFSQLPCRLVRFRVEQLPNTAASDSEVWEVVIQNAILLHK
ncbi:hypothetical protein CMUST_10065 [Corynebacterium mustelae]|uniref:Uncharacterized protein n=1 Tax=Corynebacterium mustelae TaxID=571915 RepID=A0A0G3GYT9_9CORY|nr:hypothetical protein CMUST_10065 [Corynebacterium mustelae]